MAVIPWVAQTQFSPPTDTDVSQTEDSDLMEADDNQEQTTMDIEDNNNFNVGEGQSFGFGEMRGSEGVGYLQPPHCMIPQPPQNTSTPITWFR